MQAWYNIKHNSMTHSQTQSQFPGIRVLYVLWSSITKPNIITLQGHSVFQLQGAKWKAWRKGVDATVCGWVAMKRQHLKRRDTRILQCGFFFMQTRAHHKLTHTMSLSHGVIVVVHYDMGSDLSRVVINWLIILIRKLHPVWSGIDRVVINRVHSEGQSLVHL